MHLNPKNIMSVKFGITNIAKEPIKAFIGVDGISKNVKKIYAGVNGQAKLVYPDADVILDYQDNQYLFCAVIWDYLFSNNIPRLIVCGRLLANATMQPSQTFIYNGQQQINLIPTVDYNIYNNSVTVFDLTYLSVNNQQLIKNSTQNSTLYLHWGNMTRYRILYIDFFKLINHDSGVNTVITKPNNEIIQGTNIDRKRFNIQHFNFIETENQAIFTIDAIALTNLIKTKLQIDLRDHLND